MPNITLKLSVNPAIDTITFLAEYGEKMKSEGTEFESISFFYNVLFDGGMLRVPIVFEAINKKFAFFFIYNEDDVKKYNFSKELLTSTEYPNPIYLSTVDCMNINGEMDSLTPFHLEDLSYDKKEKPKGKFGMWWRKDEDEFFHKSLTQTYLTEIYNEINGYETLILGYLLTSIKFEGFETI